MTDFALFAVLIVVGLEFIAWGASLVSAHLLSRPVPRLDRFLADQTEKLRARLNGSPVRSQLHPTRGWEFNRGVIFEGEWINSAGIRGRTEYQPERIAGLPRLAVFGDSFAYGADLGDEDCWTKRIEATHRAEILNYGVGGYGLDQTLIRYWEDGAAFRPEVVLVGLTTIMAPRTVSRYRRFEHASDAPLFKPRFVLDGEQLRLIPAPVTTREDLERLVAHPEEVRRFGKDDVWYFPAMFEHRLYRFSHAYRLLAYTAHWISRRLLHRDRVYRGHMLNPDAAPFRLMRRLTQELVAAIRGNGAQPVVVMLPMRSDVEAYRDVGSTPYEPLRAQIERDGVRVLDPVQEFLRDSDPDAKFQSNGHYSAAGNRLIAATVASAMNLSPR